eukprot:3038891-Pleurochrysis_carterae.AAC.2
MALKGVLDTKAVFGFRCFGQAEHHTVGFMGKFAKYARSLVGSAQPVKFNLDWFHLGTLLLLLLRAGTGLEYLRNDENSLR